MQVRPHSFGSHANFRAPFKVNVHKLYHAYLWLHHNNPYYHDVSWRPDWAAEWEKDEVQLPTRVEEDGDDDQALPVSCHVLYAWLRNAACSKACGDNGYAIGCRLADLLDHHGDNDSEQDFQTWNRLRGMAADVTGISSIRAASCVTQEVLAHGAATDLLLPTINARVVH